ncbi:hypothetical protein GQ457_12G002520 [Hibiscus cannabinus]
MSSEVEALRVRDRLHGIRVFLAKREPHDQFWRRSHGGGDGVGQTRRWNRVVEWSKVESAMLNRRVWVSVFGVPIHAWTSDTFERLVSHWGSVIKVAKETIEPSSFEKGRVLIETKFLEWIEECVQLCLESRVFPGRITEADTLLRGPRGTGLSQYADSDSDHEPPVPESKDQDGGGMSDCVADLARISADPIVTDVDDGVNNAIVVREGELPRESVSQSQPQGVRDDVCWCGNALWEVSPAALIPSPPDVDVDTDLVTVPIGEEDMDEGLVSRAIGPGIEGSNVEIYHTNGFRRKVRLLVDVIQSVQSLAEKEERPKGAKGQRCSRAKVVSSRVADISLSDSDLRNRKDAILREAASTVEFGKLLGAKKIGREDLIVQDIAPCGDGFLVETKVEVVSEMLIRSIWWIDSFKYAFSPSVGLSGGIIVVWEMSKFVVSNVCGDSRFVLDSGVWIAENWRFGMMAVYASCLLVDQLVFWQSLVTLLGSLGFTGVLWGDFNVVLFVAKRRNCLGDGRRMVAFKEFIEELGVFWICQLLGANLHGMGLTSGTMVLHEANGIADSLAKAGVDRSSWLSLYQGFDISSRLNLKEQFYTLTMDEGFRI